MLTIPGFPVIGRRIFGPSGSASGTGKALVAARLMIVDADRCRAIESARTLETAGAPEPEIVHSGDEALDRLGALAQQIDVVLLWVPLPDEAAVDFAGILRRCRSPVSLLAVADRPAKALAGAGRLAGITAVDTSGTPRGLVQAIRSVLASGDPVERIVRAKRAPRLLDPDWSDAVYGTVPGGLFYADLD